MQQPPDRLRGRRGSGLEWQGGVLPLGAGAKGPPVRPGGAVVGQLDGGGGDGAGGGGAGLVDVLLGRG